ncbi:helix-turn-helix transcriptional regulator [Candidatus Daviesbacteria bacterium]|nr:helix-turn-helix transcriptional regulator [Candidatus Daviesbacteria bacterium]
MKYRGYKVYTFQEDLKKRLKNPAFRKEWEDSEVEYQLGCKLIEARLERKLSQRDLAKKVGTSQAQIARIEGMDANPSLHLLKRIAAALNTKLQISF